MQESIERVLKMVADGRLTSAQGAAMITELSARVGAEAPRPEPPRPAEKRGFWGQLGFATSHTAGVYASELKDNELSMSSVDIERGEGQTFRDNRLSKSSIARTSLVRSEMTGNVLNMSSMQDVALEDARFTGCELQKCSVDGMALTGGSVEDLVCTASSLEKLSVGKDAHLRRVRLTASHMKGLSLDEGATWTSAEVAGSQIIDLKLRASALEGVDLQSVQLHDVEAQRTRLDSVIGRSVRLKKVRFADCAWTDVLLSGGETWKRGGFEEVVFERCNLRRALLAECRLTRVTLRNIDVSEIKAYRVDLSDRVIDGNEAFLAAFGGTKGG